MRKRLTLSAIENVEREVVKSEGEKHSTVFGIVSPATKKLLRCIELIDGEWVEVDKYPHILTAEKLEIAIKSKKRFVIVYGGRGSMKSVGVVDIMLAGVMDYGDKVYCLREYQESISESVHSLNKEEIKRHKHMDGFLVEQSAIYHESGGEIKYRGLARNPESVKSAAGFRRFFCEEAATLSDESIKNLTPTARNKAKFGLPNAVNDDEVDELESVQMWFVANPRSMADPFSQRFIVPFEQEVLKKGYYEDDLHLIIKMNYEDNPWFENSGLEKERQFDHENKPRAVYDHIWRGMFLDDIDNAIITTEWFDACIDAHVKLGFKAQGQERMSYDPADTGDAKAIAYMHGSVVTGCMSNKTGLIDTATDWALSKANTLKPDVFMWDADGIGGGLVRQVNDALKGKKIKVVAFKGSFGADDPEEDYDSIDGDSDGDQSVQNMDKFTNLRAQCYWMLRDRILKTYLAVEKGQYFSPDELISFSSSIAEITQLRTEICRIPRKYVPSGKIQIMNKADMKNKLKIQSPNMADAVMMLQRRIDIDSFDEDEYVEHEQQRRSWA